MEVNFYNSEFEANWHDRLSEAIDFYSKTDKYLPASDTSLNRWLSTQFKMYLNGELSKERSYYLETLIPNFEEILEKYKNSRRQCVPFDKRIVEYKNYIKKEETHLVPVKTSLGSWCNNIRKKYLNNELSEDALKEFEELGFVFNAQDYRWDSRFEQLKKYKKIYGHCNVSARDKGFEDLCKWLIHQRIAYNEGRLAVERQKKLETIGIQWNMFDYNWELKYLKVCEFYTKYRHCNITKEYKEYYNELNSWIKTQRKEYKKGILYLDRVEKLNNINFIWDYNEYIWDKKYDCAKYYLKKYPGKSLPKNAKYNLYEWFNYNKKLYLNHELERNKIKKFEGLLKLKQAS